MDNDLISRAAVINAICGCFNIMEAQGMDMTVARTIAKGVIDAAPAVDAAPVRHGRWIEDRTHIMCSVCGERYKDEIVFMPDACMSGQLYDGLEHCPHCGAILHVAAPTCGPDYCEIGGGDDADG